jgi:L-fuconolactonase
MKIDTHQHYWHYDPPEFPWIGGHMPALQRDCLPQDCAAPMLACGLDAVVAVQARSCTAETDFLLALAAEHPHIVGVVGWVDLLDVGLADQLAQWEHQSALRGVRHLLQDEPDCSGLLKNATFNRGVEALQKRQLVYDVLVFDHQLPLVTEFCARHAAHALVLDHVGKPAVRDWQGNMEVSQRWIAGINALSRLPHVMCKLSGLVTETDWRANTQMQAADITIIFECFDRALDSFGPQRLMFGSDWPVCQLAASLEAVHGLAQRWAQSRLSAQEQEAFWSGNAIDCYGLKVEAHGA